MSDHPIEGMMNATLEKIRQMVDANAVVGDPVVAPDGSVVIPVSKINYGFASGGSDLPVKNTGDKNFFGGGAGAGVTISPMAFITICNGNVKLLQIDPCSSSLDRAISMIPDMVDTVSSWFKKSDKEKNSQEEAVNTADTSRSEDAL